MGGGGGIDAGGGENVDSYNSARDRPQMEAERFNTRIITR